jgi:hypothetical protein
MVQKLMIPLKVFSFAKDKISSSIAFSPSFSILPALISLTE